MTQIEREELLRRYIDGQMTLEQEHEFFIEVALDKELRHGLKAQREIDQAIQADRGQPTPSEYASLQSSLATVLAATPGATPPVHATAGAGASSTSVASTGWAISGLAVAISVAGAAVVAMVVMYISSMSNTATPASTTPRTDPVEVVTGEHPSHSTMPFIDSTMLLKNTPVGTAGSTASSSPMEHGDKPSGYILSKEKEKPSQKIEIRSAEGRVPAGNTPLDTLSLENSEMFLEPELDPVDSDPLLQKEAADHPERAEEKEIDIKARVQWKDKKDAEKPE